MMPVHSASVARIACSVKRGAWRATGGRRFQLVMATPPRALWARTTSRLLSDGITSIQQALDAGAADIRRVDATAASAAPHRMTANAADMLDHLRAGLRAVAAARTRGAWTQLQQNAVRRHLLDAHAAAASDSRDTDLADLLQDRVFSPLYAEAGQATG